MLTRRLCKRSHGCRSGIDTAAGPSRLIGNTARVQLARETPEPPHARNVVPVPKSLWQRFSLEILTHKDTSGPAASRITYLVNRQFSTDPPPIRRYSLNPRERLNHSLEQDLAAQARPGQLAVSPLSAAQPSKHKSQQEWGYQRTPAQLPERPQHDGCHCPERFGHEKATCKAPKQCEKSPLREDSFGVIVDRQWHSQPVENTMSSDTEDHRAHCITRPRTLTDHWPNSAHKRL